MVPGRAMSAHNTECHTPQPQESRLPGVDACGRVGNRSWLVSVSVTTATLRSGAFDGIDRDTLTETEHIGARDYGVTAARESYPDVGAGRQQVPVEVDRPSSDRDQVVAHSRVSFLCGGCEQSLAR